jgi:cobalt/nickel transport system permease protein
VEGIVTAAILSFVYKMRPEILDSTVNGISIKREVPMKRVIAVLIAATVVVGGALSWFASSNPDGLEWAMIKTAGTAELEAEDRILESAAQVQEKTAFMPDYNFASADENGSSTGTSVAGLVGGAMTFGLAGLAGLVITIAKKKKAAAQE